MPFRRILRIQDAEAGYERRGFAPTSPAKQARIVRIGREFLAGYHSVIENRGPEALESIDLEWRGFAYEGAGMANALLGHLSGRGWTPFRRYLGGAGEPHIYMAYVGAGWAIARLPWLRLRCQAVLRQLDPLLGWLALDGYGFHEGYFHGPVRILRQIRPVSLAGYARRAFDQGLGRSLWFVGGAQVERVVTLLTAFPSDRHADLWSGVGLATAYAGGASETELTTLRDRSGTYVASLAQGAAFAAAARHRAGNLVAHTDLACSVYCGLTAQQAAAITAETLPDASETAGVPAYETWRSRLQSRLYPEHEEALRS